MTEEGMGEQVPMPADVDPDQEKIEIIALFATTLHGNEPPEMSDELFEQMMQGNTDPLPTDQPPEET